MAQAALLYSPNSSKKSVFVENQSGLIASKTQSGDNNFCLIDSWGSARYNTAHQMTGLMYDTIYGKNDYSSWSRGVSGMRCVKYCELHYNEDGSIQTINPYANE